MKIMDNLTISAISCDLRGKNRKEVMEELSVLLAMNCGKSPKEIEDALWERESGGSTALDGGVGVPHGKIKGITSFCMGFGISKSGVDCSSTDRKRTHLFFAFLAPVGTMSNRMDLLAKVSLLFSDESVKKELLAADTPEAVLAIIAREEPNL